MGILKTLRDRRNRRQLESYGHQVARRSVDRIPEELLPELGSYARLERDLHLGVNARGKRLSGNDRRILQQTKDTLRQTLANKHAGGNVVSWDSILASRYHYNNTEIKKEVIRRTGGK